MENESARRIGRIIDVCGILGVGLVGLLGTGFGLDPGLEPLVSTTLRFLGALAGSLTSSIWALALYAVTVVWARLVDRGQKKIGIRLVIVALMFTLWERHSPVSFAEQREQMVASAVIYVVLPVLASIIIRKDGSTQDAQIIEVEPVEFKCPKCGESFASEPKFCWRCDLRLSE